MMRPPPRSTLFPYTTLFRFNRAGRPCHRSLRGMGRRLSAAAGAEQDAAVLPVSGFQRTDRKSTRLNSSHVEISYAVFCLKKKIDGVHVPGTLREGDGDVVSC